MTPAGLELLGRGRQVVTTAESRLLAELPADHRPAFTAALTSAYLATVRRRSG